MVDTHGMSNAPQDPTRTTMCNMCRNPYNHLTQDGHAVGCTMDPRNPESPHHNTPQLPTAAQIHADYLRGWSASKHDNAAEPRHSLDAFDAGYSDEQAGVRKFTNLPTAS